MRFEGVATDALEQDLVARQDLISHLQESQLEVLEELDRRQVATGDGYKSMSQWVAARLDVNLSTARSLVRTMRRTENRPELREALANGVTFDRVEAVSRITEDVGLLEHFDIAGVEAEAARRVKTDTSTFRTGDDRFLVAQPNLDESWFKLWGGLDGPAGAIFDKVITEMADNLPELPDGTKGDLAWRKATALVQLCTSDDPVPAQVTVFVDARHSVQTDGNSGVVLEAGPAIARDALEAILCNAVTEVIARTEEGRYMDYGRRLRTVKPSMKRALMDRYNRMCAVDGCNSRYRLEAHHLTPWALGGEPIWTTSSSSAGTTTRSPSTKKDSNPTNTRSTDASGSESRSSPTAIDLPRASRPAPGFPSWQIKQIQINWSAGRCPGDQDQEQEWLLHMESTYKPSDALRLLAPLTAPWFIAGGWAMDIFVGRQTRPHADLDVAVLREHQSDLWRHLADWDLHVATAPGELTRWDGSPIPPDLHVIWCRPEPEQKWAFEVLLNDHDRSDWLFRRNHDVRMPLANIGWTADGLPCLAPEFVLLYKAKSHREHDKADLRHCLPLMNPSAKEWLSDAIRTTRGSDHLWLPLSVAALTTDRP